MYFFFFEVTMFFEVQEQVRVIARAGHPRALKLGTSLKFEFFFAFLGLEIEMGHSLDIFPTSIQKYSLLIFIMPCQYFSSNDCTKRNSKFEREDKSNGNPLLHHVFFYFFQKNFPMNTQNHSLQFFFMPC